MRLSGTSRAVASLVDGRTALTGLSSALPVSLRPVAGGLCLVASAGGPLGGDRTALDVRVEAGADLRVVSSAAQVVQPGPHEALSTTSVRLAVGPDARLDWRPQPVVVTEGAEQHADVDAVVAAGGRLLLAETVVLGRHREPPGRYRSRWRVDYDGLPLYAADTDIGTGAPAGWDGPAVTLGRRVCLTVLLVGTGAAVPDELAPHTLQLAGPGLLVSLLVDEAAHAARVLALLQPQATGASTVRAG